MTPLMHPDAFAEEKLVGMRKELKRWELTVSGNKPELVSRYKKWYATQPANGQGVSTTTRLATSSSVGIANAPAMPEAEAGISTSPYHDNKGLPILSRLLAPKKTKLSTLTIDCLNDLQYEKTYAAKPEGKELSDLLKPVKRFTEEFLRALNQVKATSGVGSNETALRSFLAKNHPKTQAQVELVGFFAGWGIEVEVEDKRDSNQASGSAQPIARTEDDTMAETEGEDRRKAVLKELDVVNSAIQHRLARWEAARPPVTKSEHLWPATFTNEERHVIREYMSSYLQRNELTDGLMNMPDAEITNTVQAMYADDDFPVPLGQTTAVIQAALLELRTRHTRRSRSQSEKTQTSRNSSPQKMSPRASGADGTEVEEDDDEDGGPVVPRRKRTSRSATSTGGDDEDQDAQNDFLDYESRDLKRVRRRGSLSRKMVQRASG